MSNWAICENEPNSNPKQSQFKPKQTQSPNPRIRIPARQANVRAIPSGRHSLHFSHFPFSLLILSFPFYLMNVPIIHVNSVIYVNIFLLDIFISCRYLSFSKFYSKNRRLVVHSTWHSILVRDSSCDTCFFGGLCVLYGKKLNAENELEKISGNCRIARQGQDNQ